MTIPGTVKVVPLHRVAMEACTLSGLLFDKMSLCYKVAGVPLPPLGLANF